MRLLPSPIVELMRIGILTLLLAEIMSGTALGASLSRDDPPSSPRSIPSLAPAAPVSWTCLTSRTPPIRGDASTRSGAPRMRSWRVYRSLMPPWSGCYASVSMLALEIDAVALRALEALRDVVAGVKLDRAVKPQ
jgi:hypothetical protein